MILFLFRLVALEVLCVFGATAFTFVLRFYEQSAKDAAAGVRRPLDRQRIAEGLGAWAREAGLNLAHVFLWVSALLPRPRIRSGAWIPVEGEIRHGLPVLLVPGYGMNRGCLRLLAQRLEATHRPVLCIDFPFGKTIEELAEILAAAAQELKSATGSEKIDVVAHSRGGLVAAWWIQKQGGASFVERLVTLGTPWSGTKIAAFGIGPSVLQMFPASALIRALSAVPLDPHVVFYAVNGAFDSMMLPPGTDDIPAPGRNIRLEGVGHMGLLLSIAAFQQIHGALRRKVEDEAKIAGFDDESTADAAERALAQFGR